MLDQHTQAIVSTLLRGMSGLYRARPYTKSIPFNVAVTTADPFPLWTPENHYFEFNRMYILSDTAAIDMLLVDTTITSVFGMVVPDTAFYTLVDFGSSGYRSLLASNSALSIVDPLATGATVKGFILGWEVTRDGDYR
jgi:hypothetical protein